jgi:bifunctional non-homologous end joining protein LigD
MVSRGSPRSRLSQAGLIRPMLATPGELPPAVEDDRWAYEMKWDGVRAVGYLERGGLRLVSRNDLDITPAYPEVLGLLDAVGGASLSAAAGSGRLVLDGELVAFDDRGGTSFERLQERMHVRDVAAARRLADTVPVVYLIFDVLHAGETSTLDLPYTDRRELLDQLAAAGLDGPAGAAWRVPPALSGAGVDVFAASRDAGMEGIVAKRRESRYRPGHRSPDWRKVKNFKTQEVIIAGWRPGAGRRAGGIGALIVAVNTDDGLRYAGGVGTGFTERMLAELATTLTPLARETPPFDYPLPRDQIRDAHWVSPDLVGEVTYAEWTSDGRLRHPSWRGLRPDKTPGEVTRELP